MNSSKLRMESVGIYEYYSKDLIGHGAFAVVYKGRVKMRPNQIVAIKAITKKNLAKSQNLLGKEIKILKELTELHHENVVALLDCKETATHVYLVMEYCNGGDLADYLNAKGTLSEDTIRSFLRQLAGAMKAMVSKDIVHRDLKPQNILLSHDGKTRNPSPQDIRLKIADFGFARFLQDGVMAATLCGSPMYMAPEVIMSLQYNSKADLWSLGTIVFQCLTGKAPFQAQTPQALKQFYEKNAQLAPKIPSGTSPELTDLLMGLLKRNASDRLDFDTFFNHPFIQQRQQQQQQRRSQPLPVPAAKSGGGGGGGSTPKNSSQNTAAASPGSMGGMLPPSPVVNMAGLCSSPTRASSMDVTTPTQRQKKDSESGCSSGNSPSEQDDFVIVPANLAMDSAEQHNRRTKAAAAAAAAATNPGKPSPGGTRRHTGVEGGRPQTEPIPVPTQKAAYQQIQQSLVRSRSRSGDSVSAMSGVSSASGGSTLGPLPEDGVAPSPGVARRSVSIGSPSCSPKSPTNAKSKLSQDQQQQQQQKVKSRRVSAPVSAGQIPDICQISPPAVQFTMGTPPGSSCGGGGHRRRTSSSGSSVGGAVTPPPSLPWTVSPNVHPCTPISSPIRKTGVVGLPPILGSPECSTANPPQSQLWVHDGGNPQQQPTRAFTVPENLSGVIGSNPIQRRRSAEVQYGGGRNVVLNYGQQPTTFNRSSSLMNLTRRSSFNSSINKENTSPGSLGRGGGGGGGVGGAAEFFPDGFPLLPPPDLSEETLLEPEHNEILKKLRFIATLVDTIIDVARGKAAPLSALTESITPRVSQQNLDSNSPQHRRLQQLLLYMRCLQLLKQTLDFSRAELKSKKLKPSTSVKNILATFNERFRHCFSMTRMLNSENLLSECGLDAQSTELTADRLLYTHAVEQCQSAALDELFGNSEECFQRYHGARILLHALQFQTQTDEERRVLAKYKEAVEKRLYFLEEQGHIQAYDTTIPT